MIAPRPLERRCWSQFAAQWGDCENSQIVPFNVIIIFNIIIIITTTTTTIIIVMIMMMMIIIIIM